jgi:hypothetical protein
MMRFSSRFSVLVCAVALINGGCNSGLEDPSAFSELPPLRSASARSNHYVDLLFSLPVGQEAGEASNYVIVGTDGSELAIVSAEVTEDGRGAILTTGTQRSIKYDVGARASLTGDSRTPIGSIGFIGSSDREPFVESAISLGYQTLLVTFSEQLDPELAENPQYYRIADPDGNTDVDITVTGAVLEPDGTTVILTTTPQENIEYEIKVTNVKSRFTCEDGDEVLFDNSDEGQGDICNLVLSNLATTGGSIAPLSISGRERVDQSATYDPDAAGLAAEVSAESCGVGVICNSGSVGGSGPSRDEELIFTLDRPMRGDRFVLGLNQFDLTQDEPVMFVSSEGQGGVFDVTVMEPELSTAFLSDSSGGGELYFESLPAFNSLQTVEIFKIRETEAGFCVRSLCITDGRRIDPTRNTVRFLRWCARMQRRIKRSSFPSANRWAVPRPIPRTSPSPRTCASARRGVQNCWLPVRSLPAMTRRLS